jgi:hypothetical protein
VVVAGLRPSVRGIAAAIVMMVIVMIVSAVHGVPQ